MTGRIQEKRIARTWMSELTRRCLREVLCGWCRIDIKYRRNVRRNVRKIVRKNNQRKRKRYSLMKRSIEINDSKSIAMVQCLSWSGSTAILINETRKERDKSFRLIS